MMAAMKSNKEDISGRWSHWQREALHGRLYEKDTKEPCSRHAKPKAKRLPAVPPCVLELFFPVKMPACITT